MIVFPENTTEKLGFEHLREATLERVSSEVGRERILALRPESDPKAVEKRLQRTREIMFLVRSGDQIPLSELPDVRPVLKRARAEGSVLDVMGILAVGQVAMVARRVRQFLLQRGETCPEWFAFAGELQSLKSLEDEIFRILTESGNIRDNASPELQQIRRSLNSRRNDLRTTLNKLLRQAAKDGYLSEQEPTIRGGRMVLAVRAEHKRKISGFVHDTSATGQTVYLEPVEALHINNDIRQLENDELREIERILRILTARIREVAPGVLSNAMLLGELDGALAVARTSLELDGVIPEVGAIRLVRAYNPHLLLRARREGNAETIVPLDFALDEGERCVVITGPNAGGKSVALKTLGLHTLMMQCGYAVPLREGSRLPVFGSIYVDMGDEQSIDDDLSTFSSRLMWIRKTAVSANRDSLILIDEAGTGTDPAEGVALYQALISHLMDKGATVVVTTHHGNLKVFAHNHAAAVNASMEFDQTNLSPTYRFRKGLPGSSYAFEIAQRIGVPRAILEQARALLGDTRNQLEHLIAELERNTQDSWKVRLEMDQQLREAQKLVRDYEQKNESLRSERDKIREKALLEAKSIMQSANRKVEEAVRRIAEDQPGKKEVKQIRKDLDQARVEVDQELSTLETERAPKVLGTPPKAGDFVTMSDGNTVGELLEIMGSQALVLAAGLRLKTNYRNLVKVEPPVRRKESVRVTIINASDDDGFIRPTASSVDLRGKRGEEAIAELTLFLDRAISAGLSQVEIVHGKGDGILRKLAHNYLRNRKEVREFALAPWEQGGPGCTIALF